MKSAVLALLLSVISISAHAKSTVNDVLSCAQTAEIIGTEEDPSCFAVVKSGEELLLMELHSRACGGDPQTSPTRAVFADRRVSRGRGLQLSFLDLVTDEWSPCPTWFE